PLPLKSPNPATLHDESGVIPLPLDVGGALDVIVAPSISHTASDPSLLRHSMSEMPSPFISSGVGASEVTVISRLGGEVESSCGPADSMKLAASKCPTKLTSIVPLDNCRVSTPPF